MSVSCEFRVLSCRGLWEWSIPRPEETHNVAFRRIYAEKYTYLLHDTQYGKEDGRRRCKRVRVTMVAVEVQ